MNKGTIVLVGCALGAGALFYMNSSADASRPTSADITPAPSATRELAHSQTTPKSTAAAASGTPRPTATPTPLKLSIAQAKSLPRPAVTSFALPGGNGSGSYQAPAEPPAAGSTPVETPAATTTPTPGGTPIPAAPPSEAPPPASTSTPIPTPTVNLNPWPIPTPPTLPPYPDGNLAPNAPSE